MLKQLEYSVTFPSTGRTLSEAVLFQGGFGAIVGPNESGKSMIVEMVRYCLFGSDALRGKADDYKNLKARLDFRLKGNDYVIQRTQNKAMLEENGEIICTGTRPVNIKIPQLMGFGLKVFDMACVANQHALLELGDMGPTERRRAVDSVIGVSVLDDLSKSAGNEALSLKRAADDLASNAREPTAPVAPEGYDHSSFLLQEKEHLDELRSQADQLHGWLAIEKKAPVKPTDPHGVGSAIVQELLDEQTARKVQRQVLEGELARIPAASGITLEDLATDRESHKLAQAYRARRQFQSLHRKPEWDQAHLDQKRLDLEAMNNQKRFNHLVEQLKDLQEQGEHACPSCDHHWPIAGDALDKVKAEIKQVSALPRMYNMNALTEEKIDGYQRILDAWNRVAEEWETVHQHAPDTEPKVRWTLEEITKLEHGLSLQDRRAEIVAQLDATKTKDEPDYAKMLREAQQYEAQLAVWSSQVAEFEAWETEKGQKLVQLTMLDMDLQGYPDLIQALNQAQLYEQQLVVYSSQLADYQRLIDQVVAYRTDADEWSKVKDALVILRSKIKQYLVPSLNKVASSLLSHMTGGERQSIVVDEDFNILVDNQSIDTLSGSGKAVANLSLRIGLGQVLTNNVFSLFMGDEIDESMDKNRSEKTATVLRTLAGRISQLLLVSHKSPSADYFIAVGENSEYQLEDVQSH
jgi:DNA repair exonuclease SbcCD ATPase subunit